MVSRINLDTWEKFITSERLIIVFDYLVNGIGRLIKNK